MNSFWTNNNVTKWTRTRTKWKKYIIYVLSLIGCLDFHALRQTVWHHSFSIRLLAVIYGCCLCSHPCGSGCLCLQRLWGCTCDVNQIRAEGMIYRWYEKKLQTKLIAAISFKLVVFHLAGVGKPWVTISQTCTRMILQIHVHWRPANFFSSHPLLIHNCLPIEMWMGMMDSSAERPKATRCYTKTAQFEQEQVVQRCWMPGLSCCVNAELHQSSVWPRPWERICCLDLSCLASTRVISAAGFQLFVLNHLTGQTESGTHAAKLGATSVFVQKTFKHFQAQIVAPESWVYCMHFCLPVLVRVTPVTDFQAKMLRLQWSCRGLRTRVADPP